MKKRKKITYNDLLGETYTLNVERTEIEEEIGRNEFNKNDLYIQPGRFISEKYIDKDEQELLNRADVWNVERYLFIDGAIYNGKLINNIKINQRIYRILNNNLHYSILNYVVKHLKPYANCIVFSYEDIINEYKLDKNIYTEEEYNKAIDIFVDNEIFGIIISEKEFNSYSSYSDSDIIKLDVISKTVYDINTYYISSIDSVYTKYILRKNINKDTALITVISDKVYSNIIDNRKYYRAINDETKKLRTKLNLLEEKYNAIEKQMEVLKKLEGIE